jgi:cellulose synthase/poly-beta-1,6-N-acetylglucosamine synthase-like glycosyltransferase
MIGCIIEWKRDKASVIKGPEGVNAEGDNPQTEQEPNVSVIIPIHNESLRMKGLQKSLLAQDCPAEIIFVDDRSTDESPALLRQFALEAEMRGKLACRIVTLKENPGLNKKQYALARGLEQAKGDYFLFTDGDCEVPPGWIRAMARRLACSNADGKTGVAIGPVFKKNEGSGFFHLYQCYDHVVRYNYLAGSTGLGAAGGGFGNNLIISRKALDEAGGYDAIPQSVTEDAVVISFVRRTGKFRIRAISLPDAAVDTEPEKDWRSFISQTLRWNNGGVFSPEKVTRFNYNLLMFLISTSILAIPLLPFIPSLWPMPVGMLLSMIENHIAVFAFFGEKMPKGGIKTKIWYLLFILFMPAYLTLMTLMGYLGIKIKWKDSKL